MKGTSEKMKRIAGKSDKKKLNAIARDLIVMEFRLISCRKNLYTSYTATPSSPGSVNKCSHLSSGSRCGFLCSIFFHSLFIGAKYRRYYYLWLNGYDEWFGSDAQKRGI